ncbi:hypothetical protein CJ030_MR1G018401 [Morella rubra]|uniref:Disease resistance protein winged helix domain-containing protein n=1 Tax=Morella rubra TaxID=262757 RepID=A0A6A1WL27_9ROSI|nr:hypothetical protein CJ030_MR1G018401 [Morella rubra]
MAQGFISVSHQHQELEDIGHDYFMDLLWRSFFQEAKVDEFGDIICCKMHGLMRDLAISVAGSLITSLDSIDERTRHVSIDSFPCLYPGVLVSERTVDLHKVPKSTDNGKVFLSSLSVLVLSSKEIEIPFF